MAVEALVDASHEDAGTGGPDPARGIFPTILVASGSGAEAVSQDEVRAAYEAVMATDEGAGGASREGGVP